MKYLLPLLALIASCDPAYADVFRPWGPNTAAYSGTSSAVKPTNGQKAGAIFRETDTLRQYRYIGEPDNGTSADWVHLPEEVTLGTALASERIEDSTTGTGYSSTSQETKCDAVDTSTNSTTVYPGPALLSYIYVNTVLSAATVIIKDDTTSKFTLPASLAAGTQLSPPGAQFRTTLIVDPDDASTGNITVCYRPLDAGTTW